MGSLDNFKLYVKKNPHLIYYVKNNKMTWQKFYELYDLYGEDNNIWDDYKEVKEEKKESNKSGIWNDILNMTKNMDVDKFQNGISSIQKALGLFGDLFINKNSTDVSDSTYQPRPVYKKFED